MEAYERCCPEDKLALCHVCYRYVHRPHKGMVYFDFCNECRDNEYKKYYGWRNIAYGYDILERLRDVQMEEVEEEASMV